MVISLADARVAAERGEWRRILGIPSTAGLSEVRKARRTLQRLKHPDKGGDQELCQFINMAADELEEILDDERHIRRWQQDAEEERRAREEERRAREARERAEADARARQEHEAFLRRVRDQRTKSSWLMVENVHKRTRNKLTLGEHAAKAFPVVYQQLWQLQTKRKLCRSRVLIYGFETEIAARRAAREDKWPKTVGLDKRCPDLAAELAGLKKAYDKAYQHLPYLRGKGMLHAHALLATRRLLREAWMLYLAMPAPAHVRTMSRITPRI